VLTPISKACDWYSALQGCGSLVSEGGASSLPKCTLSTGLQHL
jgi:hypothetical protein